MKTRTLLFLIACMLILPVTSSAQVGNLLKNKMNKVVNAGAKTVNKEIDNQIDTAVNKEADKAREKAAVRTEENKAKNQPSQQTGGNTGEAEQAPGGAALGGLFGNKIDLKYKEDYSFSSRIYMIMELYDKKEVTKMDYFMFYSSSTPSVGIETKTIKTEEEGSIPVTAQMVMDGENKCFIMLTDVHGMKMGIISAVPAENSANGQNDGKKKKDTPPNFTKTGNTKVIAGYKCDEYAYKDIDDNSTGKVWFAKDSKLKIDKKGWQNSNMAAYYGNPDFNEGIILASESYDDKGKLTAKSETKEINENFPHAISVKGYTLRQMNMGK